MELSSHLKWLQTDVENTISPGDNREWDVLLFIDISEEFLKGIMQTLGTIVQGYYLVLWGLREAITLVLKVSNPGD